MITLAAIVRLEARRPFNEDECHIYDGRGCGDDRMIDLRNRTLCLTGCERNEESTVERFLDFWPVQLNRWYCSSLRWGKHLSLENSDGNI